MENYFNNIYGLLWGSHPQLCNFPALVSVKVSTVNKISKSFIHKQKWVTYFHVNDVLLVLILLNTTPWGWFMGLEVILSFTWIILHFQILLHIPHSTKKASRLVHQITVSVKNYIQYVLCFQHSQHLLSDCCMHGTLVHRNSWKLWNCCFLGNSSPLLITQKIHTLLSMMKVHLMDSYDHC